MPGVGVGRPARLCIARPGLGKQSDKSGRNAVGSRCEQPYTPPARRVPTTSIAKRILMRSVGHAHALKAEHANRDDTTAAGVFKAWQRLGLPRAYTAIISRLRKLMPPQHFANQFTAA